MNTVLHTRIRSNVRRSSLLVAAAAVALSAIPAIAADGTWTNAAGGTYEAGTNWAGGVVAEGADATANFNTVDVTSVVPVTLTAGHTLGNLIFGDTDTTSAGGWQLSGLDPTSTNGTVPYTITLAGASPTITTNALATGSTARIDNILGGTAANVTFTGAGTTYLTAASAYTGSTTLNSANIRLGQGTSTTEGNMLGLTASTLTLNGTNTISNGHNVSGQMNVYNNIVAAAGSSTTFNLGGRSQFGNGTTNAANVRTVTGSGDLTFVLGSSSNRNDFTNSFSGFTGNVRFTGSLVDVVDASGNVTQAFPAGRFLFNGGNFAGFANANVTIDGYAIFQPVTNSGGNTIAFGSLSGTSGTAGIVGSTAGAATLSIGGLNTSTTFAGIFQDNNIVQKVGTGTLTLTSQQYHTNSTLIDAGTLALTGSADLGRSPTIRIANGATLDVSGTSSTYSTAVIPPTVLNPNPPLQTLTTPAGSTTSRVVGNYNHNAGVIAPGTISAAGTLNFNNDLSLTGGALNLEVSPTIAVGGSNDLINVLGTATLGGNVALNLGLLGGFSNGTYTLLTSAGGINGNTSGWTLTFGGRGTATLSQTSNALLATLAAAPGVSLVWTGATSGAWDVNTTPNFVDPSSAPSKFFQGDTVRFDDTATNTAVTLATLVSPAGVVVDNSTKNYSIGIAGTGSISGSASLTKRGTGTLTLGTNNSYTGGTRIEGGGMIDVGGFDSALGTGTLTMAGGTLKVTKGNANFVMPNAIVLAGGDNTLNISTGGSTARQFTNSNSISGNGTLTVTTSDTTPTKGIDLTGDTSGLTGKLNIVGNVTLRTGAVAGNAGLAIDIGAGSTLSSIAPSAKVMPIGALTGSGSLRGHASSGTGSTVEYQIGALNTSTEFTGTIFDGAQGTAVRQVLITKVGTGTLTLSGPNVYTGATTVKAGTLVLAPAAQGPVLGNATVTAPNGADIQGGKLVLSYVGGTTPADNVRSILAAGYGQSPKFATGLIRSSTLASNRTLGYIDHTGTSDVTIAYTAPGDANLDLAVNFADLVALAQNYNKSGRVWSQGDFNYDGSVAFADLVLLAQNYNSSAALTASQVSLVGSSFASDFALAQSLVPEPTTLGLVAGVATMAIRRRRA